ncbi:Golgi SNAP receptor complex member 1-1-like protein [Drosera capensis]
MLILVLSANVVTFNSNMVQCQLRGFSAQGIRFLICQARKLEAQLDEHMISYRKVVAAKDDSEDKALESGIELLIRQLQQVEFQMKEWVSSGGSEVVSHTLTRHQELLQDITQSAFRTPTYYLVLIEVQEFNLLRSRLRAKQEHASLLQDFRELDRSRLDLEEGGDSVEHALLKEHVSIGRSTGQMDSLISHAQSTLGALFFQRSTFGGINTKLSNVGSRLPTINHVLSAIKRKKSTDTIILSLVASICTFLIFIYWLTK